MHFCVCLFALFLLLRFLSLSLFSPLAFAQKLGCGTSLPGLTAGKLGSKVILADRFCDWRSKKLVVKTCHQNNFYVRPCNWQEGCNIRKFGEKDQEEQPSKRVDASTAAGAVESSLNDSTPIEGSSTDDHSSTAILDNKSSDFFPDNDDHHSLSGTSSFDESSPSPLTKPFIELIQLTWGEFNSDILNIEDSSLDYILGSDCFYDTKDFEDIIASVCFLLRVKGKPNCTFLTTYQERNSDWSIDCLLDRWNLKGCEIPLESFEGNESQLLGSRLPGSCTVSLFKISLK